VERPNAIGAEDAIDVVIAWVDGRDRKHRAKRRRFLANPGGDARPERRTADTRRFSDNDEIRFCLRSIRNYAPWVRTIWLVTDDQVPAAIDRQRAEQDNIRVVDHREIFRGHEELLPTFNSLSIETMLWRIEGLADRFLYLNDDMMFVGPVKPTDFFPVRVKSLSAAAGAAGTRCSKEETRSMAIASCRAQKCWAPPRSVSSPPAT
jgi:Stealth protein CR2, conserved region 2/Stealth protein CR1, conserved region 1